MADDARSRTTDPDWVAQQVAKFTPDELRHAGEVLRGLIDDSRLDTSRDSSHRENTR